MLDLKISKNEVIKSWYFLQNDYKYIFPCNKNIDVKEPFLCYMCYENAIPDENTVFQLEQLETLGKNYRIAIIMFSYYTR